MNIDGNKTIEDLEGTKWPSPEDDSYIVRRCHELRSVPLKNFTIEDLRVMVGQGIGLDYVVPLALDLLEINPFAGGDHYSGDLLKSVTQVTNKFWENNSEQTKRLFELKEMIADFINGVGQDLEKKIKSLMKMEDF